MFYVDFLCDTAAIREFYVLREMRILGKCRTGVGMAQEQLKAHWSFHWSFHQLIAVPRAGAAGSRGIPASPLPME